MLMLSLGLTILCLSSALRISNSESVENAFDLNFYSTNDADLDSKLTLFENKVKQASSQKGLTSKNHHWPQAEFFINRAICDIGSIIRENAKNEKITEINIRKDGQTKIFSQLQDSSLLLGKLICNNCLSVIEELSLIEKVLKDLKLEFDLIDPQEELYRFVNKINYLNLIKLDLEKISNFLKALRHYDCESKDKTEQAYQDIDSYLNSLVILLQKKMQNNNIGISMALLS